MKVLSEIQAALPTFNLSFTNGVASLLMELRNFALISNRNSFVEMIFKIIKSIPEKILQEVKSQTIIMELQGCFILYVIAIRNLM